MPTTMGNTISTTLSFTFELTKGIFSRILFGWSTEAYKGDTESDNKIHPIPSFLKDTSVVAQLQDKVFTKSVVAELSDEQIVKIARQLEFWYSDAGGNLKNASNNEDMIKLASTLVNQSLWYKKDTSIKVPKVRFGKTELQMPVVTCGGMRLQATWLPDFLPLLAPRRKDALSSNSQVNIKNCIRSCLAVGINHFETARLYGTSEYQMVEALYEMVQDGEIKREDFILQTKVIKQDTRKGFEKLFNQSWNNIGEKLGYIDLLSIHAIANFDTAAKESLAVCEELKKEGKIRHIGFSTHGTSDQIMALINTEKFEYINIHYHFFGSYHGSGTMDTMGGEGNLGCVKRALELDMGVFQISPFDKGGKLYRPSKDVALTVGKELSPMEFALLFAWKKGGIHTSSVGVARPSDLDEALSAARILALGKKGEVDIDSLLDETIDRLEKLFEDRVGKEWKEKGLVNIPTCWEESSDGIGIGHVLWLHDMLKGYGMYEFCKDRYQSMEACTWSKKKSFKDNIAKMSPANPGRWFDETVDLSKALENHYDPKLAMEKLKEAHELLSKEKVPESGYNDTELAQMGLPKGYNLTVWSEMPGEVDSTAIKKVLLQGITGGRMGFITGPGHAFREEARSIKMLLKSR